MRRKKNRPVYEDDGRVIADMNVDGMPWTTPERDWGVSGGVVGRRRSAGETHNQADTNWIAKLDNRTFRGLLTNATLAGLALVGIYLAFFSLVIWLLTLIWQ